MKKPRLDEIEKQLERGKGFELTSEQYKNLTEADFPKSKSYAENRSAVAKLAKQYGFQVRVIPLRIVFEKTV